MVHYTLKKRQFYFCISWSLLLEQSWFALSRLSHPSCCFLGRSLGWWMTVDTCSWRLARWRTAVWSESCKTLSNRTSLWSRKQNRQDPRSSVCRQTGLNGSPQSWMFQLQAKLDSDWAQRMLLNLHLANIFKYCTVWLVGATVVLGYGLIAEEVFTVQAAAQLL